MRYKNIDIVLQGNGFSPKRLKSQTGFPLTVLAETGEPLKIGKDRGKPSSYGRAYLDVPTKSHNKELVTRLDELESNFRFLYACKVQEVNLHFFNEEEDVIIASNTPVKESSELVDVNVRVRLLAINTALNFSSAYDIINNNAQDFVREYYHAYKSRYSPALNSSEYSKIDNLFNHRIMPSVSQVVARGIAARGFPNRTVAPSIAFGVFLAALMVYLGANWNKRNEDVPEFDNELVRINR